MITDQLQTPTKIAATFDLTDEKERFMLDVVHRFHVELPGLYKLHDIKRTVAQVGGQSRRRVLTITSFHPKVRGASAKWKVITFDIDDVAVKFKPCSDASEARVAFDAA